MTHEFLNPEAMAPALGFSHVAIARPGRTVYVAGQIGVDGSGAIVGDDFVGQFDAALGNVVTALAAAGAEPEHVVSMTIYTTAIEAYRSSLVEVGRSWRRHMGRHYPAMALLGMDALVLRDALVEIVTVAVIPEASSPA